MEAFEPIIGKLVSHLPDNQKASANLFTRDTHTLFATPIIAGVKDISSGIWLNKDDVFENCDILNQVCSFNMNSVDR